MSVISSNLIFLRKENKLTQAEISHRLDVPLTTYASYEYGKAEPSIELTIKICEIFKTDLLVFLTTDLSDAQLIESLNKPKKRYNAQGNAQGNAQLNQQKTPFTSILNEPEKAYNEELTPIVKMRRELELKDKIIAAQEGEIRALRTALLHAEARLHEPMQKQRKAS